MRVEVDTSHDSHDEIRKVIRMLQHLVGDSQEIFTNQPQTEASPMANIFGDMAPAAPQEAETATTATEAAQAPQETAEAPDSSQSTEDLFAELFNEEELKKMDTVKSKEEEEDEEEEIKPAKSKQYNIEFY